MCPGNINFVRSGRAGGGFSRNGVGLPIQRRDVSFGAQRSALLHNTSTLGSGKRDRFGFELDPATGKPKLMLGENDRISLTPNDDGGVTITVDPKPGKNGNGGNGDGKSRRLARAGLRGKMSVSSNPDGSVLVTPDPDCELIVSDQGRDKVSVTEVEKPADNGNGNGKPPDGIGIAPYF